MPLPQAFITRYFQLINNRQFTEAQRELQRIREKITKTEWNRGYYRALLGMLLAQKHNGNQYTFFSNMNPHDKTSLKRHKNEFQAHIQSRFHDDYDRGFFSAWHDYTRLLIKTAEDSKPKQEGQTSIIRYSETTQ
jgi:cyclopropane fatty-acyl-phospholipid synthase-like methyltransferase